MKNLVLFILLTACFVSIFGQDANSEKLIIADFNKGEKPTNLGEDFGTWDKDASDTTQSCRMSFGKDDAIGSSGGRSLQLDYDVDSPNPAYNGFWMKISKAEAAPTSSLSFYIKGDSERGFTQKIKIELKDKKKGKGTFLIENITDQWQKITLTLDVRSFGKDQRKPFEEFVIVFDDVNSRPKTGRILIDQIVIE